MSQLARVPTFKMVIIGDSGVGKSSLLVRFVRNEFDNQIRSTISAAFLSRRVSTGDGEAVNFEIWDTAGQERFRSLNTPMYYRGALGAIIVFDITDAKSFENARGWFSQLKMLGEPGVIVGLAGSKADLAETRRAVPYADAAAFAAEHGMVFMETSSKVGLGVEELFVEMGRRMPRREPPRPEAAEGAQVLMPPKKQKQGGCC